MESISVRIKLFLIGLLISASLPSAAQARFEAGLLTCEVEAGVALIMSSPRDLHCVFHKSDGLNEAYGGTLQSIGAEIGVSGRGVIAWTVIAETRELPPGVLAGEFGGVEAGGAAVVGGRGQVLVGGSRRTITLQPVSVEAVPDHRQMPHYGCGSYVHLRRGQTLYGIAHECGVTVEALLDANPQITNVRRIADGALIHLPRHVGHHGRSPCGDRGILQENESLDHLAWRCGVTLHALLSANPEVRDLGRIEDGLVLRIPDREAPRRREAPVRWAKTESDVPLGWQTVSQRSERVEAVVPGTDFNATGIMSCARSRGQPMTQCRFGVKRKGNGNGSITVFWPDGGNRVIYFEAGTPAYYDQSEADGGARMTVGKEDDLFTVRIGTQRFEFPEVVITGD